jgi:hypothetical protein
MTHTTLNSFPTYIPCILYYLPLIWVVLGYTPFCMVLNHQQDVVLSA